MKQQKIKCVIWDLDHTIWQGVLLEEQEVALLPGVVDVIKELDKRGILQSISSKNDMETAKSKLEEFGLWEYFIYPQINWNSKSVSVEIIAKSINIGIDTLAFVDDQEFELEEVSFSHPEVLCIHADKISQILRMERMNPTYITENSVIRRKLYQNDIVRNQLEQEFQGTKEEFLRTLALQMKIERAKETDLQRMEELTVRTHQLNSTGYVYSYEELKELISSDQHIVLVTSLRDKYGEYGKIGLALIEKKEKMYELKLLLMSCRVMSKGVGNILLNYIINETRIAGKQLRALFVPSNKNRIMYITYKFSGFHEVDTTEDLITLEADMREERVLPDYVKLID